LAVGDRALQARSAMSFIVENEITLVGMFSQNGFQTIKDGASVGIVFDNVPDRIYHAKIKSIPKGVGQGQIAVSAKDDPSVKLPAVLRFPDDTRNVTEPVPREQGDGICDGKRSDRYQ
jgi:multidrug resistance efflux pump